MYIFIGPIPDGVVQLH